MPNPLVTVMREGTWGTQGTAFPNKGLRRSLLQTKEGTREQNGNLFPLFPLDILMRERLKALPYKVVPSCSLCSLANFGVAPGYSSPVSASGST